jgi:SAM-dependent methyltransferase
MVFPPDSLDAVFAWMVVEHLENPAAVLRKIAAALKPGGYFVFSVPNAGSWEFGVFRERWYGLDIPRHLWHFTPRTLRRLLDACGLSVQRVFHQKVLKNIGGSLEHVSGDFPLLAPLTRGLARAISWPLVSFAIGAALAGFRQGGRLTVVARKPR